VFLFGCSDMITKWRTRPFLSLEDFYLGMGTYLRQFPAPFDETFSGQTSKMTGDS
jgi:hypothetical protein